MFTLKPTKQFEKDAKRLKKRSPTDFETLRDFLDNLKINGVAGIDKKHKPHKLKGNYKNDWEAHIKPDLLIIWFEITEEQHITLLRLGSHSDLF